MPVPYCDGVTYCMILSFLSIVYCLLSIVYCLLSIVYCLGSRQSAVGSWQSKIENRKSAVGSWQSFSAFINHQITKLSNYQITKLPVGSYQLPNYPITKLPNPLTLSPILLFCLFAFLPFYLFLSLPAFSLIDTKTWLEELGLARIKIVYPKSAETIDNRLPIIKVDFSHLYVPVEPSSVRIEFDGIDVTLNTEITKTYAAYQPSENLTSGKHDVRVTAKTIRVSKKIDGVGKMLSENIEPLTWYFIVSERAGFPEGVGVKKVKKTNGRFVTSLDSVLVDYTGGRDIPTFLFGEQEGKKINLDFNFTNQSAERLIIGSLQRETQLFSDIELDKFRLMYYDKQFTANIGNFYSEFSPLTLLGTEIKGVQYEQMIKKSKWTFITGRSQDPSTSGAHKQYTYGVRTERNTSDKNTLAITALFAREILSNKVFMSSPPTKDQLPQHNKIIGIMDTLKYNNDTTCSIELSTSEGDDKPSFLTIIKTNQNPITAGINLYRYDSDFYPIAEGSLKNLKNDRSGYTSAISYKKNEKFSIGIEYENYDDNLNKLKPITTDSLRKAGYISIDIKPIPPITFRRGDFEQKESPKNNISKSQTDSVDVVFTFPGTKILTETKVLYNFSKTKFNTFKNEEPPLIPKMKIGTVSKFNSASLDTAYKDVLGISYILSSNKVDVSSEIGNNPPDFLTTKSKNMSFGLNWSIIPYKFMWQGKYDYTNNIGSNVDNQDTRYKSIFKYVVNESYDYKLTYDKIIYDDTVNSFYTYKQDIIRIELGLNF